MLRLVNSRRKLEQRIAAALDTIAQCDSVPRLVNRSDSLGRTALWFAADSGHRAVIEILCNAGADIEHKDNGGRTCLHRACFCASVDAVELLVRQLNTATLQSITT